MKLYTSDGTQVDVDELLQLKDEIGEVLFLGETFTPPVTTPQLPALQSTLPPAVECNPRPVLHVIQSKDSPGCSSDSPGDSSDAQINETSGKVQVVSKMSHDVE